MRVRALITLSIGNDKHPSGQEFELEQEVAMRLIKAGFVEAVRQAREPELAVTRRGR